MKRLALFVPLVLLLAGCAVAPTAPPPTVYIEKPGPTVTVTAEPAAPVESPKTGFVFEALGSGTVNVTWSAGGSIVQKEVVAPFSAPLAIDDYVAGVVQSASGDVGCRLTLDGTVIDEKPVQQGQRYAECVYND